MISVDALRPEFYRDASWDTPNLHRLAREGAWAERMLSVFPSVTYVNHTSLVTGVRPLRHGIMANTIFDPLTGPQPGWCFESQRIQSPALWDLATERGVTSMALSWPVSLGAPVTWNMPEVFHLDGVDTETTEALIRRNATPGLMSEMDELKRPFPQSFAEWDEWMPGTFAWIWQKHEPGLALLHILNADWTQHRFGPQAPETRAALHQVDAVLGRLLTSIDPATTTVFVVGDHGFAPVNYTLAVNRLFLDRGWVELQGEKILSFRVLAQTNGGSAAIYCTRPELEEEVLAVLKANAPGHYRIVNRRQLDDFATLPGALCALSALPGFSFRGDCGKPFLEATPHSQGQHGHLPSLIPTGFLAWGKGVQRGRALGQLSVLQVAPTVARLLGLPYQDMEGRPVELSDPTTPVGK